ncbi:hypothetical protein [Hymenobacter cheonanensis]|uniref:hypothetical protein n=1 Tax=Hymenobacter sp. CA2-7 TaxID=3063993 RepID=UPI00271433A4|nr:hypothetical protein [Hymenobacter sp. CA2-7]MDO7888114.1 hypothetical protein [Hymenobacter sp. CA2-7]
MVTPNPAPDSGRPSEIEEGKTPSTAGPITNPDADPDPNASGNPETVTQEDLAKSDGAGIRGDYGDAEQTNGLEGGDENATDASPDRADQNPTNAAQANGGVEK